MKIAGVSGCPYKEREGEILESAVNLKEPAKNSEVIFKYMDVPSCGWFGEDDGGFSVAIYPDGKLIYITYIFDEIEKTKKEIELDSKTVERIRGVLAAYERNIKGFEEHLDNGSCDGDGNIFVFYGKEIIDWNIRYHDENKLKKSNSQYYKEYLPVIRQENLMIEIFSQIAKILKTQGIVLTLYKVKFMRKVPLKVKKITNHMKNFCAKVN